MTRRAVLSGAPPYDPRTAVPWHVALWASDPAWSAPADGQRVASWRDGSGNGRNATQGTTAAQPIYRSSVAKLGSRSAVDFDGVDDVLSSSFSGTIPPPYTFAAVIAPDSLTGEQFVIAGGGNLVGMLYDATAYEARATLTGIRGGTPDTSAHLLLAHFNGGGSTVVLDGTTVASGSIETRSPSVWRFGAIGNLSGNFGNFHAGFLGVRVGLMTAGEQADLTAWSRSFYGTP